MSENKRVGLLKVEMERYKKKGGDESKDDHDRLRGSCTLSLIRVSSRVRSGL
jgi:hypothetical protein